MKKTVLIIDDEVHIRIPINRYLSKFGFDVHEAPSLAAARGALELNSFDAVILDRMLPDGNGIDLIPDLRAANPDASIVVITGWGEIPLAVEAMRKGADNFLTKPIDLADLEFFIRKSLELGSLRKMSRARNMLRKNDQPYFGNTSGTQAALEMAKAAAESGHPVLLTGETGTGKGVLARWIHDNSERSSGAFVEVNCSGLRGELLASELFGHTKGAFTSAVRDQEGLLDVADGGTLFLDEIGEMDIGIQARFLKVIEEKSYRRLGEVRVRKSDFKLICATNKDLLRACEAGAFRSDLYYRIQVLPIRIPSLHEHPEDIPGLIRHILALSGKVPQEMHDEAISILQGYRWPGNIRELKNVLERATLLSKGAAITPFYLPELESVQRAAQTDHLGDIQKTEKASIEAALQNTAGDVRKASQLLGISLATTYRKISKYGIHSRS